MHETTIKVKVSQIEIFCPNILTELSLCVTRLTCAPFMFIIPEREKHYLVFRSTHLPYFETVVNNIPRLRLWAWRIFFGIGISSPPANHALKVGAETNKKRKPAVMFIEDFCVSK